MDGKTRGGKRLQKGVRQPWPMGWAVALLVLVALVYTGVLFSVGQNEAREASQDGLQARGGGPVVTLPTDGFLALYGPGERAEDTPATEGPVPWTEDDLELLAQTVYAEADICLTTREKAAVVWCVLNRLDAGRYGDSIRDVVTAPNQFAWTEDRPVVPEYIELAEDVLRRWRDEKTGQEDVGRVLPAEYLFFEGDGWENYFDTSFPVDVGGDVWGWTLPDPYGEG